LINHKAIKNVQTSGKSTMEVRSLFIACKLLDNDCQRPKCFVEEFTGHNSDGNRIKREVYSDRPVFMCYYIVEFSTI